MNPQSCSFTCCSQPSPPLSPGGLCGPVALELWECVWCPAGLSGPRASPADCGTTSVSGTDRWARHRQLHSPWGWRRESQWTCSYWWASWWRLVLWKPWAPLLCLIQSPGVSHPSFSCCLSLWVCLMAWVHFSGGSKPFNDSVGK